MERSSSRDDTAAAEAASRPSTADASTPAATDSGDTTPAPVAIFINGVRAFNEGDPVPADTARRLNLAGYQGNSSAIYASADANGIIEGG